ncbi:DsrE family protein [Halomonas huangheensis]|uniref:Uncharacterized protein n=1 Tax=Halomonas huangheensis TaxID=1178482 RepID=W1ND45_9GAMM|nr:DsrE family protein [Halomonas huangheensis]ALM54628.1 hypothetical protein AR456_09750 [Halomonas huangheensis]ERL52970.1 hypothetical protein BJB45_16955 [Halomonas huangheensis]
MNSDHINGVSSDPLPPAGDLLVIISHGPHGSSLLREGLDMALVAAAFGRRVSLLFMGQGCWALHPGQGAGALGQKGAHATLAMLEMYDIDQLMVEAAGFEQLGLEVADCQLPISVVDNVTVQAVVTSHQLVMNF